MKISITRARRRSLQVLDAVRRGSKLTVTRRGKPSLTLEPDGSVMIREEPTAEQARGAARSILGAMRERGSGETARNALTATRKRFG